MTVFLVTSIVSVCKPPACNCCIYAPPKSTTLIRELFLSAKYAYLPLIAMLQGQAFAPLLIVMVSISRGEEGFEISILCRPAKLVIYA